MTSPTTSGKAGRPMAVVRNVAKVALLLGGMVALTAALGWGLGGYRLVVLFGAAAVGFVAAIYWYGDRFVLGMLGARELPLAEAPALHSTVERLAARAGTGKPKLYLLPDGHPRAFVVGRGPGGSSLVFSRGLVSVTTPAELEGVIGHELAHVRSRDVVVQTVAVVLAATIVELSRIGGFLARPLLFVLGPIASAFVHLLLSPRREFAADRDAAELCESPHGLAAALIRLEQAAELVEFRASPATEPLYTINPFAEEGLAALFVTHPPVAERVRRLRDLDPSWRERLRAA